MEKWAKMFGHGISYMHVSCRKGYQSAFANS